jgi:hypothetical protein
MRAELQRLVSTTNPSESSKNWLQYASNRLATRPTSIANAAFSLATPIYSTHRVLSFCSCAQPTTIRSSGGFRGVPRVPWNPLWAGPSTKKYYTDTRDRLKWNPPSLATQLRKLLWLTSACFSRKFVQKQVDWTGSFSQKRSKWAWFTKKWACLSRKKLSGNHHTVELDA